jgi:hypothetical protein
VLSPIQAPSVEVGGGRSARKRTFLGMAAACVSVIAVGAGAYFWLERQPAEPQPPPQSLPTVATTPIPAPRPVPPPDPWHGLTASPVSLEKQGDGRLVYAVGTVRNTSNRERFGVKVDLDVLNNDGDKIGSATDYTQVLEPGKEWKFRALVTDRKAVKAKLAEIKEED